MTDDHNRDRRHGNGAMTLALYMLAIGIGGGLLTLIWIGATS